jgi:hypothetical protein
VVLLLLIVTEALQQQLQTHLIILNDACETLLAPAATHVQAPLLTAAGRAAEHHKSAQQLLH